VQYGGTNWKPEGLMQKYASRMRYGVFGYLNNDGNDGAHAPTGAPLRAPQKFIGPLMLTTAGNWVANPNAEWNSTTGIMATNPDSSIITASNVSSTAAVPAVTNSGAMNYLTKFGSMTTAQHQSHDPVSEMYWGAIRYLRNQGNLAAYSNLPTVLGGQRHLPDGVTTVNAQYVAADGFPVFSDWGADPMQYYCQNQAILGIGDVYTWRDKYVPGASSSEFEPGTLAAEAGSGFDANLWLQRISQLEFNNTTSLATPFQGTAGGRSNSAYIAAAAYWAHTMDIRPEAGKPGKQTVSTYWVDVRENRRVEARRGNQHWLAAKYAGFLVDRK
jgi:type IV pilus assembly protein PilY1